MRTNVTVPRAGQRTHEGTPAAFLTPERQLKRSVMACLLWEDQFYEDGQTIAKRIADLVPRVEPQAVADIAVEARKRMNLRHVSLLLVREMSRYTVHKPYVADTLTEVVERADELGEFVALYWQEGRRPLSGQIKKGLARAFAKFDAYQLAKYDRKSAVKLRDVMFLTHPTPRDEEQAAVFRKLAARRTLTADTWETNLSRGGVAKTRDEKRLVWTRMLRENKLGGMALLRNLRNLQQAGVDRSMIKAAIERMNTRRILPFRFIAAANHAPRFEAQIEAAMFRSLEDAPKLPGCTVLLIDTSYSMVGAKVSQRSEIDRLDAAAGVAMLAREICDEVRIYAFSNECQMVPARRGFALRDRLRQADHCGTYLGKAVKKINRHESFDRLIVITDEQSHDQVGAAAGRGYMVNVATYRNGIGFGDWTRIEGWSEAVLDYIREFEQDV